MRYLFTLLSATLLLTVGAYAQSSTSIKGRIFNSRTGEPVPFATVAIWKSIAGTTANEQGVYELKGFKPGYIQLKVTAVGFKAAITGEVLVTNAKSATLDIAMEETSVSIEAVTVRAQNFRRNVESPVSLSRIGIAEIEKNPGGNRDISKVIQSFPGVSSSASFRNDLIVRGGGPSENRFFLDGVEVPTINHFSTQGASGGPVGVINVDFIREVNFYAGAFPASKGDALSSILDFKMVDGNSDKLKYRATIGASDLGLTVDGPLSQKTTFIASVRRSYLQLLFDLLGLPFLPTYNDAQFKVKTRFDQKHELTFIGLGAYDVNRLNTGLKDPTDDQRFILNSLPENDQWNYTLGAVYKHFREKGVDTWVVSRSQFYNRAYKYRRNDESQPKILDYSSKETENKLRYEHTNVIGGYTIGWGANLGFDEYFNSTYKLGFKSSKPSVTDYRSYINLVGYGSFVSISRGYLNDKLSLSFGVRADGNSYSSEMQNPLKQISPRFSASYNFYNNMYVNFNLGRYFQAPPLTSLGFADNAGVLVNKDNGIKYIQSDHVVGGLEFRPSESDKLTLEGFYKRYKNYLLSVDDSVSIASKGADFGVFGNEELVSKAEGESYGVELMYRSRDFYGFNLVSAYTLYWSKAKSYGTSLAGRSWIPSSWDNRHIFTFTGTREFKRGWEVGLKWRLLGGAPFTPYDLDKSSIKQAYDAAGGLYLDYKRFNQSRLNSYNQLDIRVDKTYYFKKWSLNFYVDIQNVLASKPDEQDAYVPVLAADGTPISDPSDSNKYVLRKVEGDKSGTVVPTVGVILDF